MSKKESARDEKSWSAFKRAQVRYRRKGDDPNRSEDIAEMVDFGSNHDSRILNMSPPDMVFSEDNQNSMYRGPMYGLNGFPGFFYAPGALSESLQMEIAYQAVSEYCESPNATNIDLFPPKSSEEDNKDESMWEIWKRDNIVARDASINDEATGLQQQQQSKQESSTSRKRHRSFKKLSWATLGYHYDWTARSYHEDAKSPMPKLLSDVSSIFARTCLCCLDDKPSNAKSYPFVASASIVNYYNIKSNMGGHRDDLELALDKPIVSLSVGLPAVFLIGGKTKDDSPVVPILIRPGDVMCMGGDCRLNFHAMARVLPRAVALPNVSPTRVPIKEQKISMDNLRVPSPSLQKNEDKKAASSSGDGANWKVEVPQEEQNALIEYLSRHRININVRQVYPDVVQDK